MVIKANEYFLVEIEQALVDKNLSRLEPLCQEAIEHYERGLDWENLVKAFVLFGKSFRVKSIYSGNKQVMNKAIEQFETGFKTIHNVPNSKVRNTLFLEAAITYVHNNQFAKADELLSKEELQNQDIQLEIEYLNARCLLNSNQFKFDEALDYASKALTLAEELGDPKLLNNSLLSIGNVYSRLHQFQKIPAVFNRVTQLSNEIGDIEGQVISFNNLAVYNASVSNYKIALDYFLKSYKISDSIGFLPHSANCLVNIGVIFLKLDNLDMAKNLFERVLKEYAEIVGPSTKTALLLNLGQIHSKQNNLEAATNMIQLCLDFTIEENYKEYAYIAYNTFALIELKKENPQKALELSKKAYNYFRELDDVNGKEECLITLASCYNNTQAIDEALRVAIEGVTLAEKNENANCIALGCDLLADIYQKSNKFEKAFYYQKLAQQNHQIVFQQKNNHALLSYEFENETKEKNFELLKSTNSVESMLLNKQTEYERQNKLLLQANEELKQFTFAVSHDLREPVRMIESYIQILSRKYSDDWNDEQHEFFHYVADGAQRMRLLLKDLLEYATLGGNALQEKTEFTLKSVIYAVELDLGLKINETNTTIHLSNDIKLNTNKNLFRLIIQNLFSNAIKFKKEGENPVILVDTELINNGKGVLITIEDNGIGIEDVYQDKVFRLFHRVHAQEKYQGTGIGLALCSKIIRMMEGEIDLKSRPGEGTTFILQFPSDILPKN